MELVGDCIIPKCFKDRDGYSRKYIDGKTRIAHRYLYEKKYGRLGKDTVIDHLCKNPPCINTDHMEAVTVAENTRRGRSAKLSLNDVKNIRYMYENKSMKQYELAVLYNVCQPHISDIVNRREWI